MRKTLLSLVLAGLLGAPLAAGEIPTPIAPEDVELLPVGPIEWIQVAERHPALVERLQVLGRRAARMRQHLEAREDRDDAGGRALGREIEKIGDQLRPLLAELAAALEPLGVDAGVLAVLEGAPRGPLRAERQAVRLALLLPDLDLRQRRLFESLVPRTDGALLALAGLRARLERADALDDDARLEARARLEQALRDTQKRYWRVVDAALDESQRAALRRRLPTSMASFEALVGHLFTLPGLSVSELQRLRALLVELESQGAPDQAALTRIQRALAGEGLDPKRRRGLQREKREVERHGFARALDAYRLGREILGPDRFRALMAVPPMLSAEERAGDLGAVLQGLDLDARQRTQVEALRREFEPMKGLVAQRMGALALQSRDLGPDSPQQAEMEMLRYQVVGEAWAEARQAATRLFVEVLRPEQVATWVVGATGR